MSRIGIMQGRLSLPDRDKIQSFPKESWDKEFARAREASLSNIEWIFEEDEWQKNPLATDDGVKEINEQIRKYNVEVNALCADYFMDVPYLKASANEKKELIDKLNWLIDRAHLIGVKYIDIPFVDNSKIEGPHEFPEVVEFIKSCVGRAESKGITLTLETSLNPADFLELLSKFDHPNVMANYDTGNSSGIGYNTVEELQTYGKFIRTVHIKDRLLNNGTKPFGTGSADFASFFSELAKLNFKGPIILQVAREKDGEEVKTAIKNREFVQTYLQKYGIE